MTDMNEATAHGVRELKALLSAALIIAQARERTREHELRQQEREMVERERQARRGAQHDPAASPRDPTPMLCSRSRTQHARNGSWSGGSALPTPPAPATSPRNTTTSTRPPPRAPRNPRRPPPPSWTSPKSGPTPTSPPTPGPSTAPSWTTRFGPGALIPPRSCCPHGKDSSPVGSTSPPPSSTPSRSARTPTSGLVNSNAIPTPAGWKPKPPGSKPSARSQPTRTMAPKYRRPNTPTGPGRAVGQRRSWRARHTAPILHRRSPHAWGPAVNSPSPTGTKPAPRAGNAEPEPPPRLR